MWFSYIVTGGKIETKIILKLENNLNSHAYQSRKRLLTFE